MSTNSGELADELARALVWYSRGPDSGHRARALWPESGPREYHTRAPVRSVSGGTVNVLLRGADEPTPCAKLSGVSAKAGDIALVLMLPSGGIVLGTIG